jgi:hypothetical protein
VTLLAEGVGRASGAMPKEQELQTAANTQDEEDRMVRVYYADDESGWAEDLGNARYRIDNVPMVEWLNIDDVVTLGPVGDLGLRPVERIVSAPLPGKIMIEYGEPFTDNWRKLAGAFNNAGCKAEGLKPGLGVVAFSQDVDIYAIVESTGVPINGYAVARRPDWMPEPPSAN